MMVKKISSTILFVFIVYLYYMRPKIEKDKRKVKITITLNPDINKRMDDDITNKSRLIEKLLIAYYGKKDL